MFKNTIIKSLFLLLCFQCNNLNITESINIRITATESYILLINKKILIA